MHSTRSGLKRRNWRGGTIRKLVLMSDRLQSTSIAKGLDGTLLPIILISCTAVFFLFVAGEQGNLEQLTSHESQELCLSGSSRILRLSFECYARLTGM